MPKQVNSIIFSLFKAVFFPDSEELVNRVQYSISAMNFFRIVCALFKGGGAKSLHTLQVLSDDEKRSIYDRFGEAGLKGAGGAGGAAVSYLLHIVVE